MKPNKFQKSGQKQYLSRNAWIYQLKNKKQLTDNNSIIVTSTLIDESKLVY